MACRINTSEVTSLSTKFADHLHILPLVNGHPTAASLGLLRAASHEMMENQCTEPTNSAALHMLCSSKNHPLTKTMLTTSPGWRCVASWLFPSFCVVESLGLFCWAMSCQILNSRWSKVLSCPTPLEAAGTDPCACWHTEPPAVTSLGTQPCSSDAEHPAMNFASVLPLCQTAPG